MKTAACTTFEAWPKSNDLKKSDGFLENMTQVRFLKMVLIWGEKVVAGQGVKT